MVTRSFEGRRSGKPLSGTLGAEAERLVPAGRKAGHGPGDKNLGRRMGMISPYGAQSRPSSQDAGLVAGNVTGGGGKATTTKT